jgi:Fe-S-cluster containining protein
MGDEFIILKENVPQMSLCTICPKPGSCCDNFTIVQTHWEDDTLEDVMKRIGINHFHPIRFNAESRSVWVDEETGKRYGYWSFRCSKLKDGRCSIYKDRPWTCRNFTPTQGEGLCVFDEKHHKRLKRLNNLVSIGIK